MRKILPHIFIISFLLLVFPISINAQNSTPPGEQKRIEVKERVDQKLLDKEDARVEIQKRVEERKAQQLEKVKEIRRERVRNLWGVLEKRFLATIGRLETLTARIEARLAKIVQEDPEADVSSIQASIDIAKDLLDEARLALDAISVDLENLLEEEDPKAAFDNIRLSMKNIKDILIEAHRILVHVIGDIKGLRVGTESPSPTVTVAPTIVVPTVTPDESEVEE